MSTPLFGSSLNNLAKPSNARPPLPPAASSAGRSALPPLLPVLLTLVIAAIALSVVFSRFSPDDKVARTASAPRFANVTEEAGLHFVHKQGATESPTTLGGAVAFLDYDRDGHPDLFFVNGAPWPWDAGKDEKPATCALYRNDGTGHFIDVTHAAGLAVVMQGMAVAVGDFDNDGYPDLLVTCVGANHLFHNRGNGTFEDVSAPAGIIADDNTWSTGATWIDIDGDGLLDLVVSNYARWPREVGLGLAFTIADVGHSYGAPTGFLSAFPTVYHNQGNGHFTLVPNSAGLRDIDQQTGLAVAKPLAIVPLDANGDGRLDLLFSYHTSENALFINQGDGSFRKWAAGRDNRHEGASAGLASASASPFTPSMGSDERLAAVLASVDVDPQGADEEQLHLTGKLAVASFDYDFSGHFGIFTGQGRAEPDINKFERGRDFQAFPQFFLNNKQDWVPALSGGFAGGVWARTVVARGIAVADIDGDGDLDIVIAQNDGSPILLRNDQRLGLPWLRIQLVATRSQRDAGGAKVEVHTPRRTLVQTVAPVMGYMAQSESTLTFGLGEDARVRKIAIYWPSGQRQEIRPESINRTLVIREP